MTRKSINITDTGLWFVHIGLFPSRISQILEGRIWVSPHSLLLVLVRADAFYAFIPASTSVQVDCAPAYSAQGFRFGAHAPSTPALNSSQSCFGANFLSRFPPSNLAAPQYLGSARKIIQPTRTYIRCKIALVTISQYRIRQSPPRQHVRALATFQRAIPSVVNI